MVSITITTTCMDTSQLKLFWLLHIWHQDIYSVLALELFGSSRPPWCVYMISRAMQCVSWMHTVMFWLFCRRYTNSLLLIYVTNLSIYSRSVDFPNASEVTVKCMCKSLVASRSKPWAYFLILLYNNELYKFENISYTFHYWWSSGTLSIAY